MAKQDVKTNTQERQENKGEQLTRGSQSGAMTHPMARLSPFDMLAMNPFALMRRMTEEMDRAFANPSGGGNGTCACHGMNVVRLRISQAA